MEKLKKTIWLVTLLMLFSISSVVQAQTDAGPDTKQNMPGNWGKRSGERDLNQTDRNVNGIPIELLNQYKAAKQSKNEEEKLRIGNMIQDILLDGRLPVDASDILQPVGEVNPPFTPDWYDNDVQVMNTAVAYSGGFRQLDLKQGEDGWLYLAVNERNLSGGLLGRIRVWRSANGGANWVYINGVQSTTLYYGSISMLVEKRSATLNDSVRVLIYITASNQSNFNGSSLYTVSFKRNGTAWYSALAGSPAAGNKFEYPSACSDGVYYHTATYMHCVVREVSNDGNTDADLKHFFSTNWGVSHSSVTINTAYTDIYPSIAYGEKNGNDSIYIAVERHLSATDYEVRVLATPEVPNTNYHIYYITSAPNIKYEKPSLTVVQQHYSVPKKMFITCTKDKIAKYHFSNNGGTTWNVDYNLTSVGLRDYSWCASDSNTSAGGYIIAAVVDQNGDSVTIRRGTPGALGTFLYKRNSVQSTGLLAPVCAIYKEGNTLYSAFAYAGQGPSSVYYNSENLIIGIEPIGNGVPDKFDLSQNYPNPFNPSTKINFSLPKSGNVEMRVYDLLGKEVAVLVNEFKSAGTYAVDFNAANLSSGIYFYSIKSGDFNAVKKMMLVK